MSSNFLYFKTILTAISLISAHLTVSTIDLIEIRNYIAISLLLFVISPVKGNFPFFLEKQDGTKLETIKTNTASPWPLAPRRTFLGFLRAFLR